MTNHHLSSKPQNAATLLPEKTAKLWMSSLKSLSPALAFTLALTAPPAFNPAHAKPPNQAAGTASSPAQKPRIGNIDYSIAGDISLPSKPTSERILHFPDTNYGGLILCDRPRTSFRNDNSNYPTARAQGVVHIPAGKFVVYSPNFNFFKNPHALDNLPANAFDGLVFRFLAMDDQDEGKADAGLQALAKFKQLRSLDFEGAEITEKGLAYIREISAVESLNLSRTEASGAFLKDCKNCTHLRIIDAYDSPIKSENMKYLARCPQLVWLSISNTGITNEAVKHFSACKQLVQLDISRNPAIDDSALPYLLGLKSLRFLNLAKTSISEQGLQKLTSALPQLTAVNELYIFKGRQKEKKAFGLRPHNKELDDIFKPISRGRAL